MQKLFASLQIGTHPAASTQGLTASFQWDYQDAFAQQDIQVSFSFIYFFNALYFCRLANLLNLVFRNL